MIDVNGVLTYWGPVMINNDKYFMFIVDNEDSYSAGEITKLAEIIELAMGMWKYTPERDARAEFIKALRRGNRSLAYNCSNSARSKGRMALYAITRSIPSPPFQLCFSKILRKKFARS